jgi:hypothetical protein
MNINRHFKSWDHSESINKVSYDKIERQFDRMNAIINNRHSKKDMQLDG